MRAGLVVEVKWNYPDRQISTFNQTFVAQEPRRELHKALEAINPIPLNPPEQDRHFCPQKRILAESQLRRCHGDIIRAQQHISQDTFNNPTKNALPEHPRTGILYDHKLDIKKPPAKPA